MKAFIILIILLVINFSTTSAKIWRVNNNAEADADFTTLQDAHNGALNGDTILVEGSATDYGSATITRTLYIVGTGNPDENPETQANTVSSELDSITFNLGSEGSILTGFETYYITINTSDIVITRCTASDARIEIGSGVSNIVIEQCYWSSYFSGYNIRVNANCQNIIIRNNYLRCNSTYSTILSPSTSFLLIYNNILYASGTSINVHNSVLNNNILIQGDFIGTNNIFNNNLANSNQFGTENGNQANVNMGNVFVGPQGNSTDGQWQLLQGSPAIGAGLNGEDCGMFGGSTPYVLSGMPPIPAIYFFEATGPGTSQGGLDIHIKAKSHN